MKSVLEQQGQEFNHRKLGVGLNPPQVDTHKEAQEISKLLYVTRGGEEKARGERTPLRKRLNRSEAAAILKCCNSLVFKPSVKIKALQQLPTWPVTLPSINT